jgi:N-acetylglucosaminyldiphosphoundecaprenol N-acetyl-beta-D-mannosaminyltransferase
VWASKILEDRRVERVSGVELVEEILKHASQKGEKVFLLGAADGVAERAAQKMSTKYSGLQISWYEGARTVSVEKNEEASMTIAKINGVSPDYLLVAYGSPWQDIWIEENRPYLRVRVAMGVGGVFDEWAGVVKVCPEWIDQLGMKWVWRVVHEPWRWKRIMRALQFGWLVMYHKLID